jgi:hypothetical protein
VKAWKEFFDECRLWFAERLLWAAVEVLPNGIEKLEVVTFLLRYLRNRAAEISSEQRG